MRVHRRRLHRAPGKFSEVVGLEERVFHSQGGTHLNAFLPYHLWYQHSVLRSLDIDRGRPLE